VMALGWAALFKFSAPTEFAPGEALLFKMAAAGIEINTMLMLLNLLPIPPLDGGRIAVSLLPHNLAWKFARLEPYGFIILLALLFTHILDKILGPLRYGFISILRIIFDI